MTEQLDLLKGYSVYQYTFLDDLSFIRSPSDYLEAISMFSPPEQTQVDAIVEAVRQRFLTAGWEGDGEIGVIWLPPFVDLGVEDTWGTYIWHVKQRNNGVSFLLSPYPLDFQRINAQNDEFGHPAARGVPVSIVRGDSDRIREAAQRIASELARGVASLSRMADKAMASNIEADLLAHNQGILVRTLHEFLDDCYLKFLVEVMNGNRAKLKIRKSRVQLSPPSPLPDEVDESARAWLTVQGVVSDMWKAYKFEPFKAKMEMLFKSVDFGLDPQLEQLLTKHVLLRNCIQHHEGCLDLESLQQLGVTELKLKSAAGDVVLTRGKPIVFFPEELAELATALLRLAEEFDAHVWEHVPTRDYVAHRV